MTERICSILLVLVLQAVGAAGQALRVYPPEPTTADEVFFIATVDCASQHHLEAVPAGHRFWFALPQPNVVGPGPCFPSPIDYVVASLGRLEAGHHTAILLGFGNDEFPREHGTATFEVRRADTPTLELRSGRFRAMVAWTTTAGGSGMGHALPLSDESGAFWFFRPDNLELLVKVLDGCAVNGRFWVLAAGVTDVGVELDIEDSLTGFHWSHSSAAGSSFDAVQDTGAFACP